MTRAVIQNLCLRNRIIGLSLILHLHGYYDQSYRFLRILAVVMSRICLIPKLPDRPRRKLGPLLHLAKPSLILFLS